MKITRDVLNIEPETEVSKIQSFARNYLLEYKKRGYVVAISGGIDSTVCLYLAAKTVSPEKVMAIYMPEKEIKDEYEFIIENIAEKAGVKVLKKDISRILGEFGCYETRNQSIKKLFPEYNPNWKYKLKISRGEKNINYFKIIVEDEQGQQKEKRIPYKEYMQIVSATNYKQRVRKNIEYYYADKLNYAVVGTSNKVELDQGFFVKNGDGSSDIKFIGHLYKSQVYQIAKYLDVSAKIRNQTPTTNTFSLFQKQDEFYFSLPFPEMDYALWAVDNDIEPEELAKFLNLEKHRAINIFDDIISKRKKSEYSHCEPLLIT